MAVIRPAVSSATDWVSACPTDLTKWIKIESTGWLVATTKTKVDAIYPWYHGPATTPAGTLAFFEGAFKATKSTYTGDLVIREGDYECNNGAAGAIDGDLWVLHGGLRITDDCTVTGSVYTRDTIEIKNKKFTVGKDVVSVAGQIMLNVAGVDIGGDVYAAGNIDTKNGKGKVNGSFKTHLAMVDHVAADWTKADGTTPVPVLAGEPTPVSPTLDQVFDATNWIELTRTTWSSDSSAGVCADTRHGMYDGPVAGSARIGRHPRSHRYDRLPGWWQRGQERAGQRNTGTRCSDHRPRWTEDGPGTHRRRSPGRGNHSRDRPATARCASRPERERRQAANVLRIRTRQVHRRRSEQRAHFDLQRVRDRHHDVAHHVWPAVHGKRRPAPKWRRLHVHTDVVEANVAHHQLRS